MSFNKWKDEYGLEFEPNYSEETRKDCLAAYEAGQQSKQDEVDELKKRIESAMELLEYNEYVDSALQALEILKGEETK